MHIFLNLEGTVIDSWESKNLINTEKVGRWLKSMTIAQVGIFSFAIINDRDRKIFTKDLMIRLQDALKVKIYNVPTLNEMKVADSSITGVNWKFAARHKFIPIRGKVGAFTSWCKFQFTGDQSFGLLDDTVPNMTISNHDTGQWLDFVRVDKI